MTRDDALKSMDAVVQCLYIQVEKSVCDDVFGHWLRCKEALDAHDAEQCEEIERLRGALRSLHAMVKGECPSLLDDDSGGCGQLDIEIDELLQPKALTQEPQ